jgi:hypothetical protein
MLSVPWRCFINLPVKEKKSGLKAKLKRIKEK